MAIEIARLQVAAAALGRDELVQTVVFVKLVERRLDLSSGIPSHDRFNAILGAIKPAEFEKCLLSWITALYEITGGQLVAIDGKTLRRSFDAASSKSAIHMVSACATANHISLGQVMVDEKSNEITAIPKLLEILELAGALVTIYALGCQIEIAEKIIAAKADYCLPVKGNQPTLHEGIVKFVDERLEDDFACVKVRRYETQEKGHGREETSPYFIRLAPDNLPDHSRWAGLKAISIVVSSTQRGRKDCGEVRYYILSRYLAAKRFAAPRWAC